MLIIHSIHDSRKKGKNGWKVFRIALNKYQDFCQMLETNFPDFPKNFPGIEISVQRNAKKQNLGWMKI